MKSEKKTIFNICASGIFLALALVLPFFTGQIPSIGSMILPMHLPIIICGFVIGWPYGLVIGFLCTPFTTCNVWNATNLSHWYRHVF